MGEPKKIMVICSISNPDSIPATDICMFDVDDEWLNVLTDTWYRCTEKRDGRLIWYPISK